MEGNLFLIVTDSRTRLGNLTPTQCSCIQKLSKLVYNQIKDDSTGLEKKVYLVTTTEDSSEQTAKIILENFKENKIQCEKNSQKKLWVQDTLVYEGPIIKSLYNELSDQKDYYTKIVLAGKGVLNPLGSFINRKKGLGIKKFSINNRTKYGYYFDFNSGLHYPLIKRAIAEI